jgi:SAM-dependent methyltransferase
MTTPAEPGTALTDRDYWAAKYPDGFKLPEGGTRPSWAGRLARFLPPPGSTCLEVGVVPGAVLLYLARQCGFACTGIDFSPWVEEVCAEFARQQIKASFVQADFLAWETDRRFDLVYSQGFIEHFTDYQPVIERHWALVRPGGLLLLSVPALTPVQLALRQRFYEPWKLREVLGTHNLDIMSPAALRSAVSRCPGCTVVDAAYLNGMAVWFAPSGEGVKPAFARYYRAVKLFERIIARMGVSSRWFSPEAFVLAGKADDVQ